MKIDAAATVTEPVAIFAAGAVTTGPLVFHGCPKCGWLYVDHYTAENHPCMPSLRSPRKRGRR